MCQQYPGSHAQVQCHHRGHQFHGYFANPLYLAHHHQPDQQRQYAAGTDVERQAVLRAGPAGGHGNTFPQQGDELIRLKYWQCAEHARHGKQHRQRIPAFAQAFPDHIHGPAAEHALAVVAAVHHGEGGGIEFGGDADQRGDPHPEHRAGAADGNGNGNTGDIAEAESAGKRCGERLCMGQMAGVLRTIVAPAQQRDGMAEMAERAQAGIQGQEYAAAHQQQQHRCAPHCVGKLVQGYFHGFKQVHQYAVPLSL